MDWDALDRGKFSVEREATASLLGEPCLTTSEREVVNADAESLVREARTSARRQGVVEGFLQEFSLGTREGLALMCLAEALLRTPDDETRDALIAEKIGPADWAAHLGRSDDLFVNVSTWGLMLTGRLIEVDEAAKQDFPGLVQGLVARLGEPVIRAALAQAVRIMGDQFVLGRTIEDALKRARKEGFLCSFDMLGEGARTACDAERYERSYAASIEAVGAHSAGLGPEEGHGVSVKLSALSPRYEPTQGDRIWEELYPRLKRLALIAARHDINLTIDAEEADRLVISLKLLERLARDRDLGAWTGLGLAVQAYQKRAPAVIAAIAQLARDSGRRLMVRLVKGAYWDTEIKRAQIAGRPDYPVFTRKASTDLSYLVAARALIEAAPYLYAQFATHNAHTLAAVRRMADGAGVKIEHQRLHGMGHALYRAAEARYGRLTLRAYAPVGGHETLLPYLVRRLLENGANTSFVHALLDERVPVEKVVVDPIAAVEAEPGPHSQIPIPRRMYADRLNSPGVDLSAALERLRLEAALSALDNQSLVAGPIISGLSSPGLPVVPVVCPSDHSRIVGYVAASTDPDIDAAFKAARKAQRAWDAGGGERRARVLRRVAEAMEAHFDRLAAICVREAGKTWLDAIAEVREAVDFLRYYAHLAERQFEGHAVLTGPAGEANTLALRGRGVFACISPWNFPLAIFTGQISAALAAGNAVLAKPAEQTPLIAAEAVRLFHRAGLEPDLLHLVPGSGPVVGAAITGHADLAGVTFTGGTETAWTINRALAARDGPIIPFIAETGGLNGLFVDTTALREQVVDDVVLSAFSSAGQRCSALRLLFLPKDTADHIIEGVKGAMDALEIGDPARFSTDIGPVIDEKAHAGLEAHMKTLEAGGRILHRLAAPGGHASFFGPALAEIPLSALPDHEVFGPILHVVRYEPDQLEKACAALASKGYGLTLGVHSRIERFARLVQDLAPAGNVYVNRSTIGAVVGVQPFGGQGLSGTGPKAGGPHALLRYGVERALSVNIAAQGGDPALLNL